MKGKGTFLEPPFASKKVLLRKVLRGIFHGLPRFCSHPRNGSNGTFCNGWEVGGSLSEWGGCKGKRKFLALGDRGFTIVANAYPEGLGETS